MKVASSSGIFKTIHQKHKYENYEKMNVTSSSGKFKTIVMMVVIYYYMEKENYKVFKFHVNNSSYFEIV